MKLFLSVTPVVVFVLSFLLNSDSSAQIIAKRTVSELTIMVYMGADNNLDRFGIKDLDEMKKSGPPKGVNLVVFHDGSGRDDSFLGVVTRGNIEKEVIDEPNSADPAKLEEFVKWSANVRPARKYMLVLWDHGNGWKNSYKPYDRSSRAIIMDDTSSNEISLPQLHDAMENIEKAGIHINILGFDACLMAMAEVIYELADFTDIIIASEQTEPGDGWPYDMILSSLGNLSPERVAKEVVHNFARYYSRENTKKDITLAAINAPAFKKVTKEKLTSFIRLQLLPGGDYSMTTQQYKELMDKTQNYRNSDYHDLAHLLRNLGTNLSRKMAESVIATVMENKKTGSSLMDSYGISIYAPSYSIISTYFDLSFAKETGWGDFLRSKIDKIDEPSYDSGYGPGSSPSPFPSPWFPWGPGPGGHPHPMP